MASAGRRARSRFDRRDLAVGEAGLFGVAAHGVLAHDGAEVQLARLVSAAVALAIGLLRPQPALAVAEAPVEPELAGAELEAA